MFQYTIYTTFAGSQKKTIAKYSELSAKITAVVLKRLA